MYMMWGTLYLGVCYFVPLDILFSTWFFFVLRKLLEVLGRSMGWRDLGWDAAGFPFTRSQASGAWIALFLLLVWAERYHLIRVLRATFSTWRRGGGRFRPRRWMMPTNRLPIAGRDGRCCSAR